MAEYVAAGTGRQNDEIEYGGLPVLAIIMLCTNVFHCKVSGLITAVILLVPLASKKSF